MTGLGQLFKPVSQARFSGPRCWSSNSIYKKKNSKFLYISHCPTHTQEVKNTTPIIYDIPPRKAICVFCCGGGKTAEMKRHVALGAMGAALRCSTLWKKVWMLCSIVLTCHISWDKNILMKLFFYSLSCIVISSSYLPLGWVVASPQLFKTIMLPF